ncbi:MAG TPA: glycoside hydrolase family 3 N-terminal domain-containing protein [Ktedonobacterales bacterium]|nr:glycoside hydrolase family 3 N-terminal domain-containing protein [Ktedonobacterales bacterium]
MRETKEPGKADELTPATEPNERPRPGSRAASGALRHPKRVSARRERTVIWTASVIGAVAGVVLLASLLGRFFLTQNGTLAPTPAVQLGITPVLTYPVRHSEPIELRNMDRAVDAYIRQMSLDDELGQMIQVQFTGPGLAPGSAPTIPSYWLPELEKVHVGSIILYWYNIQSIPQVQALTKSLQSQAIAHDIPLLIGTDEEGGQVDYLAGLYGSGPSEWSLGGYGNAAKANPQAAYNWGKLDGQHLKALGINADFAPVVDVRTTPNPSIEDRMYATDPTTVTTLSGSFIDGLHSQGIPDTLKHWPGIGWSSVDAHEALPVSNRSLATLESVDWAPYKALLASGRVDMIMPTHVLLTQVDPNMPSSLSPILLDGILRQQLGYQGVLITDALYMGALTSRYSMAQSAVLAVEAGEDILSSFYDPGQVDQVMAALHQAIDSGKITKARIDLSVKRILELKMKYGIWTPPNYNG